MGRDLVLWNVVVTDEYLYPGLVGKSFFMHYFCKYFYMGSGFVTD